jgi:hypothetical protein
MIEDPVGCQTDNFGSLNQTQWKAFSMGPAVDRNFLFGRKDDTLCNVH